MSKSCWPWSGRWKKKSLCAGGPIDSRATSLLLQGLNQSRDTKLLWWYIIQPCNMMKKAVKASERKTRLAAYSPRVDFVWALLQDMAWILCICTFRLDYERNAPNTIDVCNKVVQLPFGQEQGTNPSHSIWLKCSPSRWLSPANPHFEVSFLRWNPLAVFVTLRECLVLGFG